MIDQEELAIARAMFAAMNRGESVRPYVSPEIVYVNPADAVEPGTTVGPQAFGKVTEIYEWKFERIEYHVAGHQLLACVSGTAEGRGSGIATPFNQGYLMDFEDGTMVRFQWFTNAADALELAGVPSDAEPLCVDDPP